MTCTRADYYDNVGIDTEILCASCDVSYSKRCTAHDTLGSIVSLIEYSTLETQR